MMQVSNAEWSMAEQQVAQTAFKQAYAREINALIEAAQAKAIAISEIEDLWRLHDFLSAKRHEVDGKYDYQYSALIFVFAELIKEGWLHLSELEGLERDKLAKIAALTRM
jgi:Photoprotection regulator fluorescence recovery protein